MMYIKKHEYRKKILRMKQLDKLPTVDDVKEFIKVDGGFKSKRRLIKAFNIPSNIAMAFKEVINAALKDMGNNGGATEPAWQRRLKKRFLVEAKILKLHKHTARVQFVSSPLNDEVQDITLQTHGPHARVGDTVLLRGMQQKEGLVFKLLRTLVRGGEAAPKLASKHPTDVVDFAIQKHDLPTEFPPHVLEEAKKLKAPVLGKREDLRHLPLVTIDGADAKDFDDAVYARQTDTGWRITVAIADVAHYVKQGSHLDTEAYKRGNSVYFPNRVIPMLPERLSNNLCSLVPNEDRACMGVHMDIDKKGKLKKYKFFRGLMRSHHRFTYEEIQQAYEQRHTHHPLWHDVISPLYEAYHVLRAARDKRGALNINSPEWKVDFDEHGAIKGLSQRVALQSHQLIEEMMVLANVAAATALSNAEAPCMYRVHDKPDPLRVENLKRQLIQFKLIQNRAAFTSQHDFNKVLEKAEGTELESTVSDLVLRTQSQAKYQPHNIGHYGLNLDYYGHFTSPIRRYSDLLVHRSLIQLFSLGDDGLHPAVAEKFDEIGHHISQTERQAADAEREVTKQYIAQYATQQGNKIFTARITNVLNKGLFVMIDDIGVGGLLPIRALGNEYYIYDEEQAMLIGERSRRTYQLGQQLEVRILKTNEDSGFVDFKPVDAYEAPTRQKPKGKPGGKRRRGKK